jgi:hypothetical protein
MGLAYPTYLNSNRIYGCKTCKTHLANHDDIISRVRPPLLSYPHLTTQPLPPFSIPPPFSTSRLFSIPPRN